MTTNVQQDCQMYPLDVDCAPPTTGWTTTTTTTYVAPPPLAETGFDPAPLVIVALLLIMIGILMMIGRKR